MLGNVTYFLAIVDRFKVEDMAERIKKVQINDMETLSWMDCHTKKTAVKKVLFDHFVHAKC